MTAPIIEWGVAGKAYPGEHKSGDQHVVIEDGNTAMIAVVDGIGHGAEAAEAADAAVDIVQRHAGDTVERLFSHCHERLSATRGAAMTLACFDSDDDSLTWLGAGNVLAALVRDQGSTQPEHTDLLIRSGVVGSQLPALTSLRTELRHGDLLVLSTDGISARFIETVRSRENLQRQADRILANYQVPNDDALVLLVRYNGSTEAGHVGQ